MNEMSFLAPKQILVKTGGASCIADSLVQFSVQNVLIITDQGLIDAGLINGCVNAIRKAGLACTVFTGVKADPSEDIIFDAVKVAISSGAQMIIGIGGGSSMDVAKVVAVLANPQTNLVLADLYGVDSFNTSRLPLVLVPTTAGTGSEVTPISIVTTGETTKAGIVSRHLLPDLALLDAELTLGLPAGTTAATGIDAMVHAIEAFTGKLKKNPISDMYALKALALLSRNIQTAAIEGRNIKARENMLLGSMLAGQAFANSPVGAVHALAYPLGGHFHIPHGLSNALVLTEVMTFNLDKCHEHYAQLAQIGRAHV